MCTFMFTGGCDAALASRCSSTGGRDEICVQGRCLFTVVLDGDSLYMLLTRLWVDMMESRCTREVFVHRWKRRLTLCVVYLFTGGCDRVSVRPVTGYHQLDT